ncbi:MAG: hypothetical protein KatS3mg080_0197 [Anoxybacillus sp.]|nr:MAG: hypothetical protein KatS3mg080_0197 [Anoxybacillus sp.]
MNNSQRGRSCCCRDACAHSRRREFCTAWRSHYRRATSFGVEQRRILREKGQSPDVLFMTATPIPRTLAITAFGEMDVSIIDEMPKGRKKIETYWVKHDMLERVFQFIAKQVDAGHQAYVICPLIEESEKLDVQNAIDVHAMLTHYYQRAVSHRAYARPVIFRRKRRSDACI